MKLSSLVFSLLILSFAGEICGASIISDQVFEPDTRYIGLTRTIGYQEDWLSAQTFTVGRSGNLVAIEILAAKEPLISAAITLEVRSTSAGFPVGGLAADGALATSSLDAAYVPSALEPFNVVPRATPYDARWVRFDLSPIPVAAGDVLAMVARSSNPGTPAGFFYWIAGGELEYTAGSAYYFNRQRWTEVIGQYAFKITDAGFRTYVDVLPEPCLNSMVLAVGLFLLQMRERKVAGGTGSVDWVPLASCQCRIRYTLAMQLQASTP